MIVKHIIIHHSATRDGKSFSWPAIKKYHMSWRAHGNIITREVALKMIDEGHEREVVKPWGDIAYHRGIELVGEEYKRLIGRPLSRPGVHCPQQYMNSKSIGFCFVGDYDKAEVPEKMWLMGLEYVRELLKECNLKNEKGIVLGHRELNPERTCPGKLFNIDKFREEL